MDLAVSDVAAKRHLHKPINSQEKGLSIDSSFSYCMGILICLDRFRLS